MKRIAVIVFGISLISFGHTVVAQTFPVKPVRILVGFAPGGGTDIMARVLGAKMTESVKQQFIIENRPGANANVAAKLAAEAPADGYTILFMSVAHIMSKPVYKNLGYDIERDFSPITVISVGPPGGNGRIMRIGLDGYACASAAAGARTTANAISAWISLENMSSPDFLVTTDDRRVRLVMDSIL